MSQNYQEKVGDILNIATQSNASYSIDLVNGINILISLLNIITTLLLTGVNLYFTYKAQRKENVHKAIFEYYLPVKYELIALNESQNLLLKSYSRDNIDMFCTDNSDLRYALIDKTIIPFIDFFDNIRKYCFFPNFDRELLKFIKCYKMLIQIKGLEKNFDLNLLKEEYTSCSIVELIAQLEKICVF